MSVADGFGAVVVLPPSKPTILLAALLLNPNSVVGLGALQQAIWGDEQDQPATARAALQTCVLRLRQLFGKHHITDTTIETVHGGYRIVVDARALDLVHFRGLMRRAALAGGIEDERDLLNEALALWRGPLLANVPSEALHRDAVPQLTEERLRAIERASDIKLALGETQAALPDLLSIAREYPGHERLTAQLVEALYRSGRQADALAEIRLVKTYLRDELGIDPGQSMQRLETDILRGTELAPAPMRIRAEEIPPSGPAPASTRIGAADTRPADEVLPSAEDESADEDLLAAEARDVDEPGTGAALSTTPSTLPDVAGFTGRVAVSAALRAGLTEQSAGPNILLVTGPPGIGKTALARHVAHGARNARIGSQLLIAMTRPDGLRRPADELLAELGDFLDVVRLDGLPPAVVVLDDVLDTEHVRALLARCGSEVGVIMTSRTSLTGLVAGQGALVHRLLPLDAADASDLLGSVLGAARIGREPAALAALVRASGHFPLALRVVGARLLTRPLARLADEVTWLDGDRVGRFSALGDPYMSMANRLARRMTLLDPDLAAAFLLVGSSARQAHSIASAGELFGLGARSTERMLDRLVDANLLEEQPGRYQMHDLLRAYASAPPFEPQAAVRSARDRDVPDDVSV
ncbi:AfsR/SARP family transcriptional regulator [Cryptosporangium minutisporangium]|uniref:AfsR/SARP family transcriptional regulator n=1 Tax=Cryptosporangium minutisporangium TaxID=113569 RepID=UPI0031E9FF0B